jgi:ATP/maltotriose-dependent transcriptional regulator MalT/DNA-binding SARP family transcriptional activator
MGLPGSHTKTTIPGRRKEWLSRKRLIDLLSRLSELKLVLIAAPPGYGKTSLLVDFASRQDSPVCWLGLDALDRDPRRFIAQFIAAFRRHYPAFGDEALAVIMSDPGAPLEQEIITTLLANEVTSSIDEHFFFIVDDLQYVEEGEEIIEILNGFIERVGENCHLILASRSLPSLPCLPKMAASMQVGGISFEELSFQPDEIQALLLLNSGLHIPYADAEELAGESEGWITGIILSLQTTPVGGADQLRLARVSGVGLYEYLAQQVLDVQPLEIRSFLLRSAYLDAFDPALCEEVFGSGTDWHELISRVVRSNLFILSIGDEAPWYRYNALFQQFLQETYVRESPEAVERLLMDLGQVYRTQNHWEKAYLVYQRLNNPDTLGELILEASPSLAADGHLITLSSWLDSLPPGLVRNRPALASLRGIVGVMLGEVERGLNLLDHAIDRDRLTQERENLATSLTRRSLGRIFQGDFRGALEDSEEAYQLSVSITDFLNMQAEALRSKALCLINLDRNTEAGDTLEKALLLFEALEDSNKVALTHIDLGFSNSILGLYGQALRHYELALEFWEAKKNLVHQATVLNNIGVLLHARGDILGASKRFEEALLKARRCGYRRAETLTLASIGDIYRDIDDFPAAISAYQQARDAAVQGELKSFIVYLDLAEMITTYRQGEKYLAFELLELAQKKVGDSESDYERGLYGFRAGQLFLLNQDYSEAVAELSVALGHFARGGRKAEIAQVYLLLAEAYFASENLDRANECLEKAFGAAAVLEGDFSLLVVGRFAKGILAAVERGSPLDIAVQRLVKKIAHYEESLGGYRRSLRRQEAILPVSPPLLSVRAFGDTKVVRDGRLVDHGDWHSQVARDMFYCLLAYPEGLTKDRIGAIFWPDTPPRQVRTNFKNTLYRLRLTLGSEIVLFEVGRYRFNTKLDYWYDVKEFLDILARDDQADEIPSRILRLQRAVLLYEGPYLPNVDRTWVASERARLQQAFFSAALTLGKLHLAIGEFEAALNPGMHLLMMDSCLESAHRLLMRAHAGMGNRAAVMRQYNRCRDALWGEFHTSPSPQTVSLYNELTSSLSTL